MTGAGSDPAAHRGTRTVEVEVGGWEHECCGEAVVRGDVVDLTCLRRTADDGSPGLVETHHDTGAGSTTRVRGRVVDVSTVTADGRRRAVRRIPSGRALRGFDEDDDGHLEDLRTGEHLPPTGRFVVTVRPSR